MSEVEIPLPVDDPARIEQAIEAALAETGLSVTLRGSLKKYPGCLHWHAKNGSCAGTLEVTYWPESGRAWFQIQKGRAAPWIEESVTQVAQVIRRLLRTREENMIP